MSRCSAAKGHDLYAVLQVEASASFGDIRAAYRRAALLTHPDKGGSASAFQLVAVAFETLSQEKLRQAYDRRRAKHQGQPAPSHPSPAGAGGERACTKTQEAAVSGAGLTSALEQLRAALQAVDAAERRAVLASMSKDVRERLLAFMQMRRHWAGSTAAALACSDDESSSDCSSEAGSEDLGMLEDAAAEMQEVPGSERRVPRGVETMRSPRQRASLYRARLSFANLRVSTRFQGDLDASIEAHILLAQVRRMAMGGQQRDYGLAKTTKGIREAFRVVLTERGVSTGDLGLTASVWMVLQDRRRMAGGSSDVRVCTPILELEEALQWRERLVSARLTGWVAFRPLWVELLQHPKFPRRKVLPAREAAEFVERQWGRIEAHWQRIAEIRGRRREQAREESQARPLRRVHRFAKRVQKALRAQAAEEQREAARLRTCRKRQAKERWRWLNRKDMTMAELLAGVPRRLRRKDI